jgi:hypothetical protein
MATKLPLCLYSGQIQQLQSGDTISGGGSGTTVFPLPGGRLTLTSATPVDTTDRTDASTLYYTPYVHNMISLYSGSVWEVLTFSETSITIPSTTNTMYDVFAYNNAGTVTFETLVWTNSTTRATGLTRQDGRWVKSGDATRLYIGTFRTSGTTGRITSTAKIRYLFNANNRVEQILQHQESATTWSQNTGGIRQANGNSANFVLIVVGVAEEMLYIEARQPGYNSAAYLDGDVGIGEDSTSAFSGVVGIRGTSADYKTAVGFLKKYPSIGLHQYNWLERDGASNTGETTNQSLSAGLYGTFRM